MGKGITSRIASWIVRKGTKSTIRKLVEEERLVFLSSDRVSYTNKEGGKDSLSFKEMTALIWDKTDPGIIMLSGITEEDIKNILIEEYQKQQKGG